MSNRAFILLALLCTTAPGVLVAQSTVEAPVVGESEIVVTAERLSGSVIGDVPPVLELSAEAVESYGASSIAELLAALAPQTGPGRGRGGGGGPVVLLNGQRISGFAEIRDLPPEAIQRVQVLPEEVALQYGFAADQRVVNFILKDNFRSVTVDAELAGSTQGARREAELQGTLVRIGQQGRVTLTGEYTDKSRVLESDRDIVQRPGALANIGDLRTLLPDSDTLRLNGVLNRKLNDTTSATLNVGWQRDNTAALLGPSLTGDALGRTTQTDALRAAGTLTGQVSRFTWTATGNYDRTTNTSLTDRDVAVAPFRSRDTARTQNDTANGIYTLSGPLLQLPAGALRTTIRGGFVTTRLSSQSVRGGLMQATRLARDEANGRINIDIPLANADRDVAAALGRLSINGNLAYRKLSDFGGLLSFGYGLNWQPVEGLTFLASALGSENEPGIGELGNPLVVTPGVPTFDFIRGETVLVNRISGGNSTLLTEVQRDTKVSVNWQPQTLKGLTVGIDYFRNRSRNPVAGFPILTPEIEAAFRDRVTRDATGRLAAIDGRSVNFEATRSDVMRVGFTFQKEFGVPPGRREGRGMGGGGRRGGGEDGVGPRGGRGGGGFGRGGEGGRWTVALYDSIRLRDEIQIRAGLPVLDLLGGSATGGNGGAPRHSIDLDAGWFNKGLGFRLNGNYSSGSVVTGSTAASTLRFGDLSTFNLSAFLNFDSRKKLVEEMPFLEGARLRLSVQNIFGAVRDVRDGSGLVPLSYQPGYLDPRGRVIEIDFRKRL